MKRKEKSFNNIKLRAMKLNKKNKLKLRSDQDEMKSQTGVGKRCEGDKPTNSYQLENYEKQDKGQEKGKGRKSKAQHDAPRRKPTK